MHSKQPLIPNACTSFHFCIIMNCHMVYVMVSARRGRCRFIRKICETEVILTNNERLLISRRRLSEIELMQSEGALIV